MVCLFGGGLKKNAVRPLQLLQRKFIRICLSRNIIIGITKKNYMLLEVLPVKSMYKNIIILYIITNYKSFIDVENIKGIKNNRSFNVKINCLVKTS